MKKLMKLLLIALVCTFVFSFGACAMSLTCISHIDRDGNGRCDNCGQEVQLSRVKELAVKTNPDKLYYALNDNELDVTGGVLSVTYKDDTTEDVALSDERVTVTLPDMTSEGEKLVSVVFDKARTSYKIQVGRQRFTVTFDLGYEGGTPIPSQDVYINEHAEAPDDPSRPEWSFTGWYTANDELFDFALTPITSNLALHAGWTQSFGVTYVANYTGGTDKSAPTVGGKADWSVVPDARTGYVFAGWSASANGTTPYDFNTPVSGSLTLYAMWAPDSTATHTVTFDYNYGSAATVERTVPVGYAVSRPADPTRANVTEKGHQASGFVFGGWYTDAECTTEYDFATEISGNVTIYAKWTGMYVFEAEHVSLTDPITGEPLQGMGASGGSVGPNMVDPPPPGMEGMNASNGYYVTYLYAQGLSINFLITSDRAVSDATLVFRITCENAPFAIDPVLNEGTTWSGTLYSQYAITLNNEPINYETIEITDTTGHASVRRPFSDHVLATNLSLKKGMNVFSFITANNHGMGGTMSGTAPVIDCIKVTTSANLTWNPMTSNEFGQ